MLLGPALDTPIADWDQMVAVNVQGLDIRRAAQGQIESIEPLRPEDIADAVAYILTRDRRVAVNEVLVRAGEQTW
jgi:NADP-dependent 3-hydroxy acid dehydrogenase YdfG